MIPQLASRPRSGITGQQTGRPIPTSAPPRRTAGGGTITLPPWTRAPWLGFRQPAVLLAVIGAAAILACASSSAALFLSSASSKALQRLIAARCPDAPRPAIELRDGNVGGTRPPDLTEVDRKVTAAMTASGLPRPYRIASQDGSVSSATMVSGLRGRAPAATLFYEDEAISHLRHVASAPVRSGVWIDRTTAQLLRTRPGATITFGRLQTKVAGVYTPPTGALLRTFWCSQSALFYNQGVGDAFPPKLVLAGDFATFTRLNAGLPKLDWVSPVAVGGITLHRARDIDARQTAALHRLAGQARTARDAGMLLQPQYGGNQNALPQLAERSALIRRGLTGPVVPIAIGGSILALLLMGAAGSYWADRRAREVRLLSARGVGPAALAAKAALELAAPALIGTALGWGLGIELVRWLGPSPNLDPGAPWTAGATAAIGLAAGIALLSVVAGLRARNATERPIGHRARWTSLVPWEIAILAAALVLGVRLSGERAVTLINDVAQVNMLLVAFPLLFLAGAATLVVRLIAAGLPLLRKWSTRWPIAGYFAVRRITGAPIVTVTLLGAASLPVAVLVYSGTITATSRETVNAKAWIYAGAGVAVSTVDSLHRTPKLDGVATPLTRYTGAKLGPDDAEVLAVDPATFARFAYWDGRFSSSSLQELMTAISRRSAGLPAIVVRYQPNAATTLHMGHSTRHLDIVASPRAFPGQRDNYSDLVVVDKALLGRVDPYVDHSDEAWGEHAGAIESAMTAQHARPFTVYTPHGVVDATNYLAVTWTFGYLEALAALVGLVAVAGLMLYVATRQRARTASYAMARRMGLSRRRHLRSLLIELGGLLAAAYVVGAALSWAAVLLVYGRMDADPSRRPPPLLTVPAASFVGSAIAVVLVAAVAAFFAQRAADRAKVSEVMRLDA